MEFDVSKPGASSLPYCDVDSPNPRNDEAERDADRVFEGLGLTLKLPSIEDSWSLVSALNASAALLGDGPLGCESRFACRAGVLGPEAGLGSLPAMLAWSKGIWASVRDGVDGIIVEI